MPLAFLDPFIHLLKLLVHTLESPVNRIKTPIDRFKTSVKTCIHLGKLAADLIKALCEFRIHIAAVAKGRVGGIALFVNETRQGGKGKKKGGYYFCNDGAFLKSSSSAVASC